MTFTYTNSPQSNQIDEIRLLAGDTVQTDISLTDEQIAYFIVVNGSGLLGAIAAAGALAAACSRLADELTGGVEIKWSQRARSYLKISDDLKASLNGTDGSILGTPYVGGTDINVVANNVANPNRVPQNFNIGGMNNRIAWP
jgi:hypothetical protein